MVTRDAVPAEQVAGMMLGGSGLADEMRQAVLDRGWPDGPLLARRAVEERWAGGRAYPTGSDYLQAARLVAGAGNAPDADLLRAMAGIERFLVRQEDRWQHRYDRYVQPGTDEIRAWTGAGELELGPAQRGIDGASYLTGVFTTASPLDGTAAMVVATRAGCELLTGWDSRAAAGERVRGRLASATGTLTAPAVGGSSRLVCEEQVLAFALRYPWELDAVAAALPGYVFGCDPRDEIFAAARMLHTRGGTVNAATVSAEAQRRCLQAPSWAREMLGGPRAPLAGGYARRLASTGVPYATVEQAIGELARTLPAAGSSLSRSPLPLTARPPDFTAVAPHAPAARL